eukprot:scaffold254437_cov39-Tisochrysis_lutea.AAC.2
MPVDVRPQCKRQPNGFHLTLASRVVQNRHSRLKTRKCSSSRATLGLGEAGGRRGRSFIDLALIPGLGGSGRC